MSLLRSLANETAIYGMSHILPRILHYIVFTVYLTYTFDDTIDYGIYNDLYAYSSIILIILIGRMDTAFFRFSSRDDNPKRIFSSAIAPVFIGGLIFLASAFTLKTDIASVLQYPDSSHYVLWFAIILAFDAWVALPFARFRMENRPFRFLFFRLLNVGLTILFVLFFLEICPRLIANGWTSLEGMLFLEKRLDYVFFSNLLASAILFICLIPEIIRDGFHFDVALWKKMALYSMPLVIVGIAGSFNQTFGVPLQKYFLGNDTLDNLADAGVYGAALKIALLLNLFTVAFNYAAEPFFFKQFASKENKTIYGLVALAFTIVASLVVLGIHFYTDLLQYLVGNNYRDAIYLVPVLLFAYLFLGLYYNFSIWYKLVDKTHIGSFISIIGALITFFISIIFLPKIGYAASAWAALACYGFMAVAGLVTGKIYYPIDYPIIKIVLYILLTAGLVMLSNVIKTNTASTIISMLINTGLLLGYVFFIYKTEKELVSQFTRR